jgi:hypothetical protein
MTFNCSRRLKSSPRVRLASISPPSSSLPLSPQFSTKAFLFPFSGHGFAFHPKWPAQPSCSGVALPFCLQTVASDLTRDQTVLSIPSLCHDPHPILPRYDNGWLEILIIGSAFLGSSCCVPAVPSYIALPLSPGLVPRSTFTTLVIASHPGPTFFCSPCQFLHIVKDRKYIFTHTLHFALTSD